MVISYTFPAFGMLYQEKSGNPGDEAGSLNKTLFLNWLSLT
jgi:hypothetical protein